MLIVIDNSVLLASCMGIEIEDQHDESLILDIADRFYLPVYDAACLEVAFRRSLPLATLDRRAKTAAEAMGVVVFRNPL